MSSWIRSEQSLERHPKTLRLKEITKLELDQIIGRLHRLWWWCLDFAHDGDLRKKSPESIEFACGIPFDQLISAGFIDSRPYRRIHDWWDYSGNYLKLKYKNYPEKWQQIEKSYQSTSKYTPKGITKGMSKSVDVPHGRTDVPHGTDVRTLQHQERAREGYAGATPPLTRETPGSGLAGTDKPRSQFELDHYERRLNKVERTQTRLREEKLNGKE